MNTIELSTPALLFPAISLLLLAYTNRFFALAKLIRDLHGEFLKTSRPVLLSQIDRLRLRLTLIRTMQSCGVTSLLICVFCMFLIVEGATSQALVGFKVSLALLAVSLSLSVWEIQISANALNLQLSDLNIDKKKPAAPLQR